MDKRDEQTWVTIELSPVGEEKVLDGSIESLLRRDLKVGPAHPIFVPSSSMMKRGRKITVNLIDGYVFVASGLEETAYFALEGQPYITQVMSTPPKKNQLRTLRTVGNSYIQELRDKLKQEVVSDLEIGMSIFIIEGLYQGLSGVVTDFEGEGAIVKLTMRSKIIFALLPKVSLSTTDPALESDL